MAENKNKIENKKSNKNKKIKVISIILILLLITLGVVSLAYSQKVKLAQNNNEEQQVAETKAQEIILEDNQYMHVEIDASGDKVPVPNGFVGSKVTGENEIDSGYVIYALNEGETEETVEINDTNKDEAQKTRNQYVWVPVPDPSKFYGTDANGKKWGKLYDFDISNENETGTAPLNWSESDGIMSIASTTNSISYREPDIVYRNDNDSDIKTLGVGSETMHEFQMQMEKDFCKMLYSVKKYGGFYVGRYETGDLSKEQAVVKKGNTDINYQTWYTMYKKCKKLEKDNINVITGIIWGSQFDRTLMWIIESGAKTKEEVISESASWGNYKNASFEYENSKGVIVTKNENNIARIPTGSTEYTKANNIYDLAGNVLDWTMEAYETTLRVQRGGYYYKNDLEYSASSRYTHYAPHSPEIEYGCRATLYVK